MRITKVEIHKYDSEKCELWINESVKIKTFTDILTQFGIFAGMEITETELEEIKNASLKHSARVRAARIAAYAPISKKNLLKKLQEKGEEYEQAQAAVEWLHEIGILDDEKYADELVRRYSSRGYGAKRIRSELFKRGIGRELWEGALEEAEDPEELIDAFIRSRLPKGETDRKKIKKVTDALIRRGFSWDEIKSAMIRYGDETMEDFD